MNGTVRDIRSQPAFIHLLTSRGHISSPPLEWAPGVDSLSYEFNIKKPLYVNGYLVAHADGAVYYKSPLEITKVAPGPFTVRVNLDDGPCSDPDCEQCKPT